MAEFVPVIAVDGPSGSGKGTISQQLAKSLGWHLLDSGALYRVLALAAASHAIEFDNVSSLSVLAAHLDVCFVHKSQDEPVNIVLEGQDVSKEVRTEDCGKRASIVAAIPDVRAALLDRQRAFKEAPGLVADGRDMGTVVFANADLKVFLDASVEIRAKRRYSQLRNMGLDVSLDNLLSEIADRDKRDRQRTASPLRPADDAVIIDTSGLTIKQVYDEVFTAIKENGLAE